MKSQSTFEMTDNIATEFGVKLINVISSNIVRNGNGGVLSNEKNDVSLIVTNCLFQSCHVTETSCNGGAVYIQSSNNNISLSHISSYSCSSFQGHTIYVNSNDDSSLSISSIATRENYGNDRGALVFFGTCLDSKYYNSSCCKTKIHCNFHHNSKGTFITSYFQFVNCTSGILLGTDETANVLHCVSYANFIGNKPSLKEHGLFYSCSNSNTILSGSYLCFIENSHTLVCCRGGTIEITESVFDSYSSTTLSNGIISTTKCVDSSISYVQFSFDPLITYNKICHSKQKIRRNHIIPFIACLLL